MIWDLGPIARLSPAWHHRCWVITTTVRRWLHEPLLQFLLIGLLLFILDRAQNPVSDPQGKAGWIEVTEDDLRQLDVVWAAQWQRHPTPEEVRNLVAAKVREEILYREAIARLHHAVPARAHPRGLRARHGV